MKIRTMIVDDSESSRRSLSEILESEPFIEVVCKIGDEKELAEMVEWISPDVVFMKVSICKRGKSEIFDFLLKKRIPLILTGDEKEIVEDDLIEFLEKGAIDFLSLPCEKKDFIRRVKSAVMAKPLSIPREMPVIRLSYPKDIGLRKVIVIASSTGGPQALRQIIPRLPKKFPAAIIIVQHMSKGFTRSIAKRLDVISEIKVKEAENGDELKKGTVYFAPYGFHLFIKDTKIVLKEGKKINGVIPSADCTMESLAENFGRDSIGVILTGMGKDGVAGAEKIKKKGGRIIVQDRESSVIFGMPQETLKKGFVDKIVELEMIPEILVKEVSR